MPPKQEVHQGTLALMILKTIDVLGPLHGYGIARRIEETSRNRLTLNYGTLYPALLKLEQEGFVKAEWRQSENNRRAKYYGLTAAGRKQLARETREWQQTADLIAAFLAPKREAR
jgi:PadR family transcriptional regulator, regulatory protein PadR